MGRYFISTVFLAAVVLGACSKRPTPLSPQSTQQLNVSSPTTANLPLASATISESDSASPKIDAETLLTSKEIESVQGAPVTETKAIKRLGGGVVVSQCYFALANSVDSISLSVTQKGTGSDARDPKQVWTEAFHRETKKAKEPEENKEKEALPEKIGGLGEEAFWVKTRVGGELYVLKGNTYIRISVGGGDKEEKKIEKTKALAEIVIRHF